MSKKRTMIILVVNTGSRSIKLELMRVEDQAWSRLYAGRYPLADIAARELIDIRVIAADESAVLRQEATQVLRHATVLH